MAFSIESHKSLHRLSLSLREPKRSALIYTPFDKQKKKCNKWQMCVIMLLSTIQLNVVLHGMKSYFSLMENSCGDEKHTHKQTQTQCENLIMNQTYFLLFFTTTAAVIVFFWIFERTFVTFQSIPFYVRSLARAVWTSIKMQSGKNSIQL